MSNNSSASKLGRLAGLDSAKRAVASIAAGKSPTHSVLLYGSEGAGKSQLADLLAQSWLCTKPTEDGACGECQSCRAFERKSCADFQRFEPWGPSRILKLAAVYYDESKPNKEPPPEGTISLQTFFRTAPLMARNKVVVFEDADRLNNDAASALLKTLEEPPPHGKLILTTTAVGLILPTILSRCLALACELPRDEALSNTFGEFNEAELLLGARSPGLISRIRANPRPYQRLIAFAKSLPGRAPLTALVVVDEFRSICEEFAADDDLTARAANAETLKLLATALQNLNSHPGWVQAVVESHRRIQGNANPNAVLDTLFTNMLVA